MPAFQLHMTFWLCNPRLTEPHSFSWGMKNLDFWRKKCLNLFNDALPHYLEGDNWILKQFWFKNFILKNMYKFIFQKFESALQNRMNYRIKHLCPLLCEIWDRFFPPTKGKKWPWGVMGVSSALFGMLVGSRQRAILHVNQCYMVNPIIMGRRTYTLISI